MHQASFYQRANPMQRNDAEKITKEQHLQWRLDGHDTLLDIGCGSGDVLMDYIYPLLPRDFVLLMGTDISAKMVEHARQNYSEDKRIKFRILDIASEVLPKELCEQFDHVTSFYCLHWVQDQRQALQNIHKLLRPDGGDCLLVFLASAPIYDIYRALSQMQRWAPYMSDYERYISPLHFSKDPVKEYNRLLSETGFVHCSVELRNSIYYFQSGQVLKNSIKAICPFLERMSLIEQQDFLDEVLKSVNEKKFYEIDENTKELRYFSPYKLLVVYARKPGGYFKAVIGKNGEVKGIK